MDLYYVHYVYILQSLVNSDQYYVGSTADLKKRLESHNSGANKHTNKFKPWKIIWYSAFLSAKTAIFFEKYLKTASGIAFRRKRLI
jgi:predicted GIY-YIG superfamily endonuclease